MDLHFLISLRQLGMESKTACEFTVFQKSG